MIQEECDSDPVGAFLLDMDMDMVMDLCCFLSCDVLPFATFFHRFNLSVSCAIWSGLLLQLVFPLSAMFFGALKVLCSVMVGCHKVLCADYICSFQHHVFCKLRCRCADDSCSSCF